MSTKGFNFRDGDPSPDDEIRPLEDPNLAAALEACQLALNIMRLREPESIRARTISIVTLLLTCLRGSGYVRFLYGWELLQHLFPNEAFNAAEYLEAWRITQAFMERSPELVATLHGRAGQLAGVAELGG